MKEKPKVVLLADDDEDDRLFLTEALLKIDSDIKIIQAENGAELVEIIDQKKFEGDPALIVVDMNMPLMNGLETIQAIKTKPVVSNVPAVMLSTASDRWIYENAIKAGFKDYFVKPHLVQGFLTLAATLKAKYLK